MLLEVPDEFAATVAALEYLRLTFPSLQEPKRGRTLAAFLELAAMVAADDGPDAAFELIFAVFASPGTEMVMH